MSFRVKFCSFPSVSFAWSRSPFITWSWRRAESFLYSPSAEATSSAAPGLMKKARASVISARPPATKAHVKIAIWKPSLESLVLVGMVDLLELGHVRELGRQLQVDLVAALGLRRGARPAIEDLRHRILVELVLEDDDRIARVGVEVHGRVRARPGGRPPAAGHGALLHLEVEIHALDGEHEPGRAHDLGEVADRLDAIDDPPHVADPFPLPLLLLLLGRGDGAPPLHELGPEEGLVLLLHLGLERRGALGQVEVVVVGPERRLEEDRHEEDRCREER